MFINDKEKMLDAMSYHRRQSSLHAEKARLVTMLTLPLGVVNLGVLFILVPEFFRQTYLDFRRSRDFYLALEYIDHNDLFPDDSEDYPDWYKRYIVAIQKKKKQ